MNAYHYSLFWPEKSFQFSKPLHSAAIHFLLKIDYNESMLWCPILELILKCLFMVQSKYLNDYFGGKKLHNFSTVKRFPQISLDSLMWTELYAKSRPWKLKSDIWFTLCTYKVNHAPPFTLLEIIVAENGMSQDFDEKILQIQNKCCI